MSKDLPQAEQLNLIRVIRLATKWRKQLIYTGIAAILVSIVFTMPQIMTPMFKANSVIYPVNLQAYSKETPTRRWCSC